jgi:hypothetical protein
MAGFQMNNFYRPSQLSTDTHAKYFEDDDGSILDENILDGSALDSGLEMSPPMDGSRRDSYAVSSALFSPKEEWTHVDMQSNSSNNPFAEHNNNPFMNARGTFGQPNGWSMGNASGSCTPMQAFDGLPEEFNGNPTISYRNSQIQTPFSLGNSQPSLFSPASTNLESMPASPQKDWILSENMEHRGMPKRMRPSSPGLRSHSPLMRRDGIRKKNARFDIPAERNLMNIDHLIQQSTDEQEIKELKQQKRLLRNRQAAYASLLVFTLILVLLSANKFRLDSRQRKKQHTERLEDEKKQYNSIIADLEDQLAELRLALDNHTRKEQQYSQFIETLQMEKEEMLRVHTIETGDLRKKVSVLTEHAQKLELSVSALPSSSGFTEYSEIDNLTMDGGAWDNMSFLNAFSEPEIKAEQAVVPAKKNIELALSEPEKPAANGLLLILLLVGAFVASKGSSPSIPRMSDDVRAASATILEDIFNEAGVSNSDTPSNVLSTSAPLQSGDWTSIQPSRLSIHDMQSFAPSSLGNFADSLSQPTQEQQNEQLFSLSAAQYNNVASPDFMRSPPEQSTSQGRRNLADTLAALRANSKQSATEVYTRSLLWDQVPRDVVRNFAKLVAECNSQAAQEAEAVESLG